MQLNLRGLLLLPLLLVLSLSLNLSLTEARHHEGRIPFDTRPSPFNPNQPRPGPYI
ncbi:metchnikowin [Drosophila virilis]|uniref:metchnikowin n=1 Tax=Drosophila virilis TaxID=7244 RepID=UPI00017D3F62|nr:metchnikowin [Drosophila virilis]